MSRLVGFSSTGNIEFLHLHAIFSNNIICKNNEEMHFISLILGFCHSCLFIIAHIFITLPWHTLYLWKAVNLHIFFFVKLQGGLNYHNTEISTMEGRNYSTLATRINPVSPEYVTTTTYMPEPPIPWHQMRLLLTSSNSKCVIHDTTSLSDEYLYHVWKWSLQWKKRYGADMILWSHLWWSHEKMTLKIRVKVKVVMHNTPPLSGEYL